MKKVTHWTLILLWCAGAAFSQTSWTIYSPDSTVKGVVQLANLSGTADFVNRTRLYYAVSCGKGAAATEVVPWSPMGIVRADKGFVDSLAFVSEGTQRTVDSAYTMITGKRKNCRNYCNEKVLTFKTATGNSTLQVVIRAYKEGFAFRYRFPETDTSLYTVTGEESGIRLPASSTTCIMSYDVYNTYQPGYENYWNNNIPVGTLAASVPNASSGTPSGWAMPALFKTPSGYYALFFETDVTGNFCGMHLRDPSSNVYRLALPLPAEANSIGSVNPSWTLPWEMPWRIVTVGATPAPILENTLAFDMATPSKVSNVSWIKPGRASWSWYLNEDVTKISNVLPYISLAQQLTWEYSLVDAGWPSMTTASGGTWRDIVTYATAKNVNIILWYNSGGSNSTVAMTPRDKMSDSVTRRSEMSTISAAGVKGIKVDFFHGEKQWIIQYYYGIMKDASVYRLTTNFHGCTCPRGWQRTYPNLMSMEAVRGEEYYKYDAVYPAAQPARNTILPFTRNSVGSMDYTPLGFKPMANAHLTTYAHELALTIVFESGIQHFCDDSTYYLTTTITNNVRNFISNVPTTWDSTMYLQGTPGTYLALARKKGNDWYIGGNTGEASARTVGIKLSFLASGCSYKMVRITDGTSNTTFSELIDTVTSSDSISVTMRANGGFVVSLTNLNPVSVLPGTESAMANRFVHQSTYCCVSESFVIPQEYSCKTVTIDVYSLNGKMLASRTFCNRNSVSFRNDFGITKGIYIAKLTLR